MAEPRPAISTSERTLNDETLHGLIALTSNERFGWDAYRRFIQMFGRIVMDVKAERFDMVIADIEMPGQDGYSLIRKVRSLDPEHGGKMPAVALTAFGRPEDRIRSLKAGFNIHLTKPVDPAELTVIVASVIGRTG